MLRELKSLSRGEQDLCEPLEQKFSDSHRLDSNSNTPMYNSLKQIIYRIIGWQPAIDVSNLYSGTYFVTIETDEGEVGKSIY